MKKNKILHIIIGIVLVCVPLFSTTIIRTAVNNKNESANYVRDQKELKRIVDVINIIENRFVGKETPNKKDLYEAAVVGVVNALKDQYSQYMNTEELKDFNEDMDGEYVGVGMTVQKKKGEALEVVAPFIGSPAEKVGIRVGDKVTKIDDKDILPLTLTQTTKLLKGTEGTKVTIEVIRKDKKDPMKFTITRAKIKVEMIESKMLDNKIGYVSLLRFGNNVGDEVQKTIEKLELEGMQGLIFDLRMNPGGSLKEAQDISSLFVDEDLIVYLKYKDGHEKRYNRTKNKLGDFPLVVLVNKGSASASEIVTGALKDYKRATIIGEKTFGKGIVQQVMSLDMNDALKLTIAQYFTPKGDYIHEKGIEPDIKVEMEELLTLKGYTNVPDEAREARKKEIEEILKKDKGEEETKKIISAGDVQLKKAIEEINKMIEKNKDKK